MYVMIVLNGQGAFLKNIVFLFWDSTYLVHIVDRAKPVDFLRSLYLVLLSFLSFTHK